MKTPPQTTIQLFNGNQALAIKFVEKCKEEFPKQIMKMAEAIQSESLNDIADLTHSFKGQLSYLGAEHLVTLAASLDQVPDHSDWYSYKANAEALINGINQLLTEL